MTTSMDPRTHALLHAPIPPLLLKLGAPTVLVLAAQAAAGLIETWFIGRLGVDALTGVALVFPVVMLMQMMSAGAIGGGISSAIARALGGGRSDDAHALAWHALAIGVGFGLLFTAVAWLGGRMLYTSMGGQAEALRIALVYSNWVFAGAVLIWICNTLASVIRGTGDMATPAVYTLAGTVLLIPTTAALVFGFGPIPPLGAAGGALAFVLFYGAVAAGLAAHLAGRCAVIRLRWRGWCLQRAPTVEILRVGVVAIISTVATNLSIAVGTAYVAHAGSAAIAGYGTGARLEYLLVPLVFGLGGPLVAIVGTCFGAGNRARALRATWTGAAIAFGVCEAIGLAAAAFPHAWIGLFTQDPGALAAGSMYLRIVGPAYGFFGLGLLLYFASQGAGRLAWPVIGNAVRLALAVLGGWLALRFGWGLAGVYAAQAVALVVYGLTNAVAIHRGVWFTAGPANSRLRLRASA